MCWTRMKKIQIICDFDLDGAGCCLLTKWSAPDNEYLIIGTDEKQLEEHLKNADPSIPLFVYDLAIEQKHIDLADRSNVVFMHHHDASIPLQSKQCKIVQTAQTSCTKLLQTFFKNKKLEENQQKLLDIIDDYDSYTLKYKKSVLLNMLFWSFNGNKLDKFIQAFEGGDRVFTEFEKNMLRIYVKKMQETIQTSEPHRLNLEKYNIIIFYANFAINELCADFANKYDADGAVCIDPVSLKVWVRINRNKDTLFDSGAFARNYLEGCGYKNIATGQVTPEFVDLSQSFTKL